MLKALARLMNKIEFVHYSRKFVLKRFVILRFHCIHCIVFHLDIGLPAVQPSSRSDSDFPPKKRSRFKTRHQDAHVGIHKHVHVALINAIICNDKIVSSWLKMIARLTKAKAFVICQDLRQTAQTKRG